jgi:hypothetical protein
MLRRGWTDSQILAALRAHARQHGGQAPAAQEWFRASSRHPATSTVTKHFGSWHRAVCVAGLEPRSAAPIPRERCPNGHPYEGNVTDLASGRRRCPICKAQRLARDPLRPRQRRRYEAAVAAGLCPRCRGERDDPGFTTCSTCRAEMRARWRERYAKRAT